MRSAYHSAMVTRHQAQSRTPVHETEAQTQPGAATTSASSTTATSSSSTSGSSRSTSTTTTSLTERTPDSDVLAANKLVTMSSADKAKRKLDKEEGEASSRDGLQCAIGSQEHADLDEKHPPLPTNSLPVNPPAPAEDVAAPANIQVVISNRRPDPPAPAHLLVYSQQRPRERADQIWVVFPVTEVTFEQYVASQGIVIDNSLTERDAEIYQRQDDVRMLG